MVVLRQTIWRDDPDDGVAAVFGVAFDCATATAQEALNRLQRDIVALRETDTERERETPLLSSPPLPHLISHHRIIGIMYRAAKTFNGNGNDA